MREERNADRILKNGSIYTVDLAGNQFEYEAMAVAGEKIIALGRSSELAALAGPDTEWMDLDGNTVLPGLSDSHLHASMTTELLFDFSLRGVEFDPDRTRADYIRAYQEMLRAYRAEQPEAKLIRGMGWNPVLFVAFAQGQPQAQDLDEVVSDVPVMLRSFDHHYLWVNSKALELAGIDRQTETPRNGVVERDEAGNPTGIFQETTAMDLLIRNLPGADYTVEEYKAGIRFYQEEFGSKYGNTLIFDAYCSENARQAYRELEESGDLHMRVKTSFYADPSLPEAQFNEMIRNKGKYCSEGFGIRTVKFFIDGSGLSFYLKEPFEKEWLAGLGMKEGYRGYVQWTQEELNETFLKLDTEGLQIHLHCMTDGAVKMAVDAFEYVSNFNDVSKNRHTITHLMLADERDIERMAKMGIIAAIQPMWAIADSMSEQNGIAMLGKERIQNTYRFGAMRKAGCRISCGTDFPVTIPPSPFIGMGTGMTRTITPAHPEYETYKGLSLGAEEEKVSLKEMVEGYTISSAYQCFLEDITGSLEMGKSADFVILDRNIRETKPEELGNIQVKQTWFKGKVVYREK